jgi:hypothetical protein
MNQQLSFDRPIEGEVHEHAPRPQDSIVINRNYGIGRCYVCGASLVLVDGKWVAA